MNMMEDGNTISQVKQVRPVRKNLPPLPDHMKGLPVDERGYPVPAFVEWIGGVPDFRVMRLDHLIRCVKLKQCWVCGNELGRNMTFVIGPMCAINRISAEPPSHLDCAEFSAKGCPFLTLPKAVRREAGLPEMGTVQPEGMIARNPGSTLLWVTRSYTRFNNRGTMLFEIGPPEAVHWYAHGRRATREEVIDSITSGLPILQKMASDEGNGAVEALARKVTEAYALLPSGPEAA